jgi:hypothetical protein
MPDRSKVMTQTTRDTLFLQVGGWARGLTNPPYNTWICFETSTEASVVEEEIWGGHGPKTGRSAIEEEEEEDVGRVQ